MKSLRALRRSIKQFRNTLWWAVYPYNFLDQHSGQDCFQVDLGGQLGQRVFLTHPTAIREMFCQDSDTLDGSAGRFYWRRLLGKHSIIVESGNSHLRLRRLSLSVLRDKLDYARRDEAAQVTAYVKGLPRGKPISAYKAMLKISLQLVLKKLLGSASEERLDALATHFREIDALLRGFRSSLMIYLPHIDDKLLCWSLWRQVRIKKQAIENILIGEIETRRKHGYGTDLLSNLIGVRDMEGENLSDEELRSILLTLIVAGYGTTTTSLAWTIYCIGTCCTTQERIFLEVAKIPPRLYWKGESLPFLDAVCREAMRLYPVFPWVSRLVKRPVCIHSNHYDIGTNLSACIYLTHRRPELYPNPTSFLPERFLEHKYSPYEYMPFGGGIRRCLGDFLGLEAIRTVIAAIMRNCTLSLHGDTTIRPIRFNLTVGPANGPEIVLQDRYIKH